MAATYTVFNTSCWYVGKAKLLRDRGKPGLPSRFCKHLRCTLRPNVRDGNKPRYRLLRKQPIG
eukprot:4790462-Amphidinium_carterae.1